MVGEMVEAGLVNIALFLGIAFGAVLAYCFIWAMSVSYKNGFRNYYHELDDTGKKDIDGNINNIELNLEQLATKTNTKYFKDLHNKFAAFKAFMKQRKLNP